MSAKIILNRKSEWVNKARGIKFFIDDVELGKITNGSSEEFVIASGFHKMQCKIDWCSSGEVSLQLNEGETKFLKVKSGMKYYAIVYIAFIIVLLSGFIMKVAHIAKPPEFLWFQVLAFVPVLVYMLYYLTIGRKKYLVLEEDTENIFN